MAFGQYSGGIGAVAGGIIGAIIGAYTPIGPYQGAMLGMSVGGMAGGIAGQVFWPEKVDITHPLPPKPHENRVQVSTYGAPIPVVYESARIAGNIIYMSDVLEHVDRSKHRNDGVRYYEMVKTYTATFAIAFSEGPVVGLARIWVNGKIFADYRDPAGPYYPTGDIGLASANLSTTIARAAAYFSTYLGTETQTEDSAIVALLTDAETPTYRGIFYIVFRDFPVGEFSGVPTIEVEIDTPIDTCSDYFEGVNGSAPVLTALDHTWNDGNAVVINDDKLRFTGGCNHYLQTQYSFLGEFDFSLDFYLTNFILHSSGWIYLHSNEFTCDVGYQIPYSAARYYEASGDDGYGYVEITEDSGKLRIRRDSSNNIYAYYWNASLSRWEWDGDVAGVLIGSGVSGPATFYIDASLYALNSPVMDVGDFIVTAGCDNTQPVV